MTRFKRARLRRRDQVVAEAVQFTDDTFVVRWLGEFQSTVTWKNATEALCVHNKDSVTILEWVD